MLIFYIERVKLECVIGKYKECFMFLLCVIFVLEYYVDILFCNSFYCKSFNELVYEYWGYVSVWMWGSFWVCWFFCISELIGLVGECGLGFIRRYFICVGEIRGKVGWL